MNRWKNKLLALLHDPPSKALDIAKHGERSEAALRAAGISAEEARAYNRPADWLAAAADRIPFPQPAASGMRCTFDGRRNIFRHPLGPPSGEEPPSPGLKFDREFASVAEAEGAEQAVQPVVNTPDGWSEDEVWRARFFAHWRLWPQYAAEKDWRFAFMPADTRLPDHTIWNHMHVVSALAGCADPGKQEAVRPAFLKFQLGPVQEFIAQARSTRDLWSGSYLLSWLMASGLKKLSELTGPDAVIFPSLRGQPLFDLHWKEELWAQIAIGDKPFWKSLGHDVKDQLTPNLPNVFLAVVPADQADHIAQEVKKAVAAEWNVIADKVWNLCASGPGLIAPRARFDAQVDRFLSTAWQTTPWPETVDEALRMAEGFATGTPVAEARSRVQAVVNMATQDMPVKDRDRRYYTNDAKTELNNVGIAWSVLVAFNAWQLDAARQCRDFSAWDASGVEREAPAERAVMAKDALNGKDEAVAGGTDWLKRCEEFGDSWQSLFKKNDRVGAITLIKRTWHRAYLEKHWGFKPDNFKMPNTRGLAAHDPEAKDPRSDCDEKDVEDIPPEHKYFAVLALDGDEIGKWVSGEKMPTFASQLADYTDAGGQVRHGAKVYFERNGMGGFLDAQRPLSPAYHLQFSEALSNFALRCVRPIVEAFDGRLIYAGGDDVLALLPADTALACASALRQAFRGETVTNPKKLGSVLFQSHAPGFLSQSGGAPDGQNQPIPFIVPGPAAEVSVGVAMAHFKAPLQDVVRAAQAAEKRAKNGLGRAAVAVTLMKRSGEIIEWGCRWDFGGLEAYESLLLAMKNESVSGKFPHRLAQLLSVYQGQSDDAEFSLQVDQIMEKEIAHVISRQGVRNEEGDRLHRHLLLYRDGMGSSETSAQAKLTGLTGLCATAAFAHRIQGEEA